MPDLDLEAARSASHIAAGVGVDLDEKLINDASAVLAENGPYAFFLYLFSKAANSKGTVLLNTSAGHILSGSLRLLNDHASLGQLPPIAVQAVSQRLIALSADLKRLLLARKLLTQQMTYLRYHAKVSNAPAQGQAGG
jgi:hypothetical protein